MNRTDTPPAADPLAAALDAVVTAARTVAWSSPLFQPSAPILALRESLAELDAELTRPPAAVGPSRALILTRTGGMEDTGALIATVDGIVGVTTLS